jgi:polar amino acid transport system permease protein
VSQPAVSAIERDRQAYRRAQARRSTAIAAISTVVFAGALFLAVTRSPGWPRVRQQFFNLEVARDSLPRILEGLWLNIRVLVVAEVLILIVGLAVAVTRTLRGPIFVPLRALAAGYTDLFRGIPLIILLYLIGFGVPGLRLQGVPTSVVVLGTTAMVLTYSAYVAEVFRSGIEGVHESQRAAARSLGLSSSQTMRSVVLPQAVRRVVPPLMNDFVSLQKDVALISVLGPVEAMRKASIEVARTFNFTPYVAAAVLFLCVSIPLTRLTDHLLQRERREMMGTVVT